jgi:hypothetical protein
MASPFDYIGNILSGKDPIWNPETSPGEYKQFMTNRGLSYHYDTVMLAQLVNHDRLPDDLHYQFLFSSVNKKRRPFTKWVKAVTDEDIQLVQTVYKCNRKVAEQYLKILNTSDLEKLRMSLNTGGKNAT